VELIAGQAVLFTLVFIRMSGLMIFFPFFGEARYPVQLKAGFAFLLAALVYGSALGSAAGVAPSAVGEWGVLALAAAGAMELGVGLILGFSVQLMFSGVQLAGQLIGRDMGFAIVNVIDPVTSRNIGLVAQFKLMLAVLVMLAVNGHHLVIGALADSYNFVPVLSLHVPAGAVEQILGLGGMVFVTAIQIAAPILATVFLVTVALGFLGKTVPQMNIFIVGFPLRIGLGLAGLCLVIPFVVRKVAGLSGAGGFGMAEQLWSLLESLR